MTTTPAAPGGFVGSCPCGWRTFSQTRVVVEQRCKAHREICGGGK